MMAIAIAGLILLFFGLTMLADTVKKSSLLHHPSGNRACFRGFLCQVLLVRGLSQPTTDNVPLLDLDDAFHSDRLSLRQDSRGQEADVFRAVKWEFLSEELYDGKSAQGINDCLPNS